MAVWLYRQWLHKKYKYLGGINIEKQKIKITAYGENYDCYLKIGEYKCNHRLYLGLNTDEESFNDITINLPEYSLYERDNVFINGDMSTEVKNQLNEYGILAEYLYTVKYNMGKYDCYRVDLEKLKHYDPDGYEKYIIDIDKDESINI